MARKIKDLAVRTGSYTDGNGQEKGRYMGCGALMESDDGSQFIMLNRFINYSALPRKQGSESILVSVFDIRERDNSGGSSQQSSNRMVDDLDDDVPF